MVAQSVLDTTLLHVLEVLGELVNYKKYLNNNLTKFLHISDERMFQLMDWSIKNELVQTEGDFWAQIEFPRTNVSNVKKGLQGFTKEHIRKACVFTGANANWLLGVSDKNMFREAKDKNPMQLLKEAVKAIELEMSKNGSKRPLTKKLTR